MTDALDGYIDRTDSTSSHPVVGLVAVICERILPCDVPDCRALVCAICWSCVSFWCFAHGVEHHEAHISQ